jgi:cytosine/adenosine deaminase-related metal-dependent hydrolase
MPNLHSHAFQRAMAGLAEVAGNPNDSFWTWRDLMYRLVGKISPEQLGVIARQLYIEMLKAGYTSVAEFHTCTTTTTASRMPIRPNWHCASARPRATAASV